jgi:hypothetical protein
MVTGPEDLGNERWHAEQQEIDHMARDRHMAKEAERAHERNAADHGETVEKKRPWWKFWGG